LLVVVNQGNNEDVRPVRVRRGYRRWLLLAGVLGVVVWLNGPGLRWLGPMVVSHYLGKAGMRSSFVVEGSLSGGLVIRDLEIRSDGILEGVSVDRVRPLYQFSELLRGRVRGIEIDGAHVDLRVGLDKKDPEKVDPFDLAKIADSLRRVRALVVPYSVDVRGFTLHAQGEGKRVFALGESELRHEAGSEEFQLAVGTLTDAAGKEWAAQQVGLTWGADRILLDRLDPFPGVGLRGLMVNLAEADGVSAEWELHVGEAVFLVNASPGLASIGIELREGRLDSGWVAERFGWEIPVKAGLTSLSLQVDDLLPDVRKATGSVRMLLEEVEAKEWRVPELNVGLVLLADRATLAASGRALGTGFSMDAEVPVVRGVGSFVLGEVAGKFRVDDVPALVAGLSERVEGLDRKAEVPVSTVAGGFTVGFENNRPARAGVDVVWQPEDLEEVAAMDLDVRWLGGDKLEGSMEIDGMKAAAEYDLAEKSYVGRVVFDGFNSTRISRWLALVKVETKGEHHITGKWSGKGVVQEPNHSGELSLEELVVGLEGQVPIRARGDVAYDFPKGFVIKGLEVKAKDQTVAANVRLAEGLLTLADFSWRQDGREMASGSAALPAPEDFRKWRETLARDRRPLEVSIESVVLPLVMLKDWLPAASRIDPLSTGQLSLKVSGTYAEPEIDAVIEAKNLRSPEQPKLPPADVRLVVSARENRISIEGNATSPDVPPASFTGSMAFRPAAWAENRGLIGEEKITARVDLPRLDLARYATLVPAARKVGGVVTGRVEVAGVLGKPELSGSLQLSGGVLELKNGSVPVLTGIGATADFLLDRVTLRDARAEIAGGSLRGTGELEWSAGKLGALDFRLTGRHVPLLRNDSMIVRAHADLRLTGTYEAASLTGTVSVVDSLFFRDIEILPIGVPFLAPSAAALPRIDPPENPALRLPEPFISWRLDVRAHTEKPFLIRGNIASGQVTGDVRVRGTIGNPEPDGLVQISNARAALPFSRLEVRRGTLRFTPQTGFDPIVEIRGTSNPRPYRVTGYVHGRMSDPQLVLTSTPPLPANEIMTLLATGTTTSGLENSQAAGSRALQLFAEELRRGRFPVGRRLRPLLGLLDRVDFTLAEADPYSNDAYSNAMLSITDRWYLSAGVSEEGDSRFLAIWRLTFR
jgi:hypothetical protein